MAGEDFPTHNCHATCDDLANLLHEVSNLTHQLEVAWERNHQLAAALREISTDYYHDAHSIKAQAVLNTV